MFIWSFSRNILAIYFDFLNFLWFLFFSVIVDWQCSVNFYSPARWPTHIYICVLFLPFSSIMFHRTWLDVVPCAVQQDLIAYLSTKKKKKKLEAANRSKTFVWKLHTSKGTQWARRVCLWGRVAEGFFLGLDFNIPDQLGENCFEDVLHSLIKWKKNDTCHGI